jgi:hypothetical protein
VNGWRRRMKTIEGTFEGIAAQKMRPNVLMEENE